MKNKYLRELEEILEALNAFQERINFIQSQGVDDETNPSPCLLEFVSPEVRWNQSMTIKAMGFQAVCNHNVVWAY